MIELTRPESLREFHSVESSAEDVGCSSPCPESEMRVRNVCRISKEVNMDNWASSSESKHDEEDGSPLSILWPVESAHESNSKGSKSKDTDLECEVVELD